MTGRIPRRRKVKRVAEAMVAGGELEAAILRMSAIAASGVASKDARPAVEAMVAAARRLRAVLPHDAPILDARGLDDMIAAGEEMLSAGLGRSEEDRARIDAAAHRFVPACQRFLRLGVS